MFDIKKIINESIEVKKNILKLCHFEILSAAELMKDCIERGNKIMWCGNGGSAADAQHMAAELMGGLVSHDRKALASIALTVDSSFITAWANDTSYSTIFSRQIEGLGKKDDVLVAISTSGNSKNIIKAIASAKANGIKVIILTGKNGGKMQSLGDIRICIPSSDTQRIQEGHILVEHILCEYVESFFIKE